MPRTHIMFKTVIVAGLVWAAAGCELGQDASKFREAIPEARSVALAGPSSEDASAATSAVSSDEPWADGPWAWSYAFTRTVRDGINGLTGQVLGTVWLIVHTRPTSVDADEATWGPYADALDPVEWRLRVTEVGEGEYEYFLEGRPKQGGEGYQAVLSGKGFGRTRDEHGDGRFVIDIDAWNALEPMKAGEDSGELTVTHDLPRSISEDLGRGDRWVTADMRPSASEAFWVATSHQHEDGAGSLLVDARDDLEDSATPALEDLQIAGQYDASGAGRSDFTVAGGDVPPETGAITAIECWGTDFTRVYYTDSLGAEPSEGDAASCAFSAPAELSHLG